MEALVRRAQQAIGDPNDRPPVEELEFTSRQAQLQYERYVRRWQIAQICLVVGVLLVTAWGYFIYRDVNRTFFAGALPLKRLSSVLGARTAMVRQLVPDYLADHRTPRVNALRSALPSLQVDTRIEVAVPRAEALDRWSSALFELMHGPGSRDHEHEWSGFELEQQRLAESEHRERVVRHEYHRAAARYNRLMQSLPARFVAGIARFPDRMPDLTPDLQSARWFRPTETIKDL